MKFFSFLALFFFLAGCGGRTPSAKTAHSLTHHFFNRYSKKYPASFLGQSPPSKVEVNHVEEKALHLAEVEAFLNLKNGQVARVVLMARNTPPFGWRVASWEVVDLR